MTLCLGCSDPRGNNRHQDHHHQSLSPCHGCQRCLCPLQGLNKTWNNFWYYLGMWLKYFPPVLHFHFWESVSNVQYSTNFFPFSHQATWQNSCYLICLKIGINLTRTPRVSIWGLAGRPDAAFQRSSSASKSILENNLSSCGNALRVLILILPPGKSLEQLFPSFLIFSEEDIKLIR